MVVWIAVAGSLVAPSSPAAAAAAARTEKREAAVARTGRIVAAVMAALLALAAVLRKDPPTSKRTPVAGITNIRREYSDRD